MRNPLIAFLVLGGSGLFSPIDALAVPLGTSNFSLRENDSQIQEVQYYRRHSGYRLYFNGRLVSGPDARGYTRQQARDNCMWNVRTKPEISVRCTYDGEVFFEN